MFYLIVSNTLHKKITPYGMRFYARLIGHIYFSPHFRYKNSREIFISHLSLNWNHIKLNYVINIRAEVNKCIAHAWRINTIFSVSQMVTYMNHVLCILQLTSQSC